MKKPNFFIIGAPKCGTTSMAAWLGEHPQIFMSEPKEPNFFCTDIYHPAKVETLEEYLQIFQKTDDRHIAVGEASPIYLISNNAVKNIVEFDSDAKFIVMVRNPIDMAQSMHGQVLWGREIVGQHIFDEFEDDWKFRGTSNLEFGKCKHGQHRMSPILLRYDKVCKLGEQIQRLLQIVDEKSVLFIVMEDIISNPLKEYRRVLEFLDVPYDGRSQFFTHNSAKRARSRLIQKILSLVTSIKRVLGIKRGLGLLKKVYEINENPYKAPPLRTEFKQELIECFKDDVQLLSSLLNRDFSHWLR